MSIFDGNIENPLSFHKFSMVFPCQVRLQEGASQGTCNFNIYEPTNTGIWVKSLHHQYDAKKGVNLTKFSKLVVRSTFSIFVPGYYTALPQCGWFTPWLASLFLYFVLVVACKSPRRYSHPGHYESSIFFEFKFGFFEISISYLLRDDRLGFADEDFYFPNRKSTTWRI
jgi:hypothetical protein